MNKIEETYLNIIKEDSNEAFLKELHALLDKYGVSIGVDIHHAQYPYNNIEAIIKFKDVHKTIAEYKTDDIYLADD